MHQLHISMSMIVKITNNARVKDYRAILGNTVSIVDGFDEKLSLKCADCSIVTKAMLAGKGYIIEDTTLKIDGKNYNTISRHDPLSNNMKAVWSTKIAYHSGHMIHFYEADISGRLRIDPLERREKLYFGDIFIPDGYTMTISEIEKNGNIEFANARQLALTKLLMGESYHVDVLEPIFQKSTTPKPPAAVTNVE